MTAAATKPAEFTVHYQNDIWDGRPMVDPCVCRHPGMMAFPINLRIEKVRGRNAICVDADICMDCGSDRIGQVDLVEGLTLAYHEVTQRLAVPFLWRIYDLVEHRRADLEGQPIPLWMAIPLGMSTADINEARQRYRVQRCAEYMGERMGRYGAASPCHACSTPVSCSAVGCCLEDDAQPVAALAPTPAMVPQVCQQQQANAGAVAAPAHTPGPWRVVPGTPSLIEAEIGDHGRRHIIQAFEPIPHIGATAVNANARLAAAAPCLLAALLEMVAIFREGCADADEPTAVRDALAAIARAEGRAA